MVKSPLNPANSPVPESGTTVTDRAGVPRVMVPVCCRTNDPWPPVQGAVNPLKGDIAGRTLGRCQGAQHLALRRGHQVAGDPLVDRQAAELGRFCLALEGQRCEFDCESAFGDGVHALSQNVRRLIYLLLTVPQGPATALIAAMTN